MAASFVQTKGATGSGTSPSVTLDAAPTQNNLLVLFVGCNNKNTSWSGLTTAGWSAGTLGGVGGGGARSCQMFWKIAGSGESATISFTQAATGRWGVCVAEYSGMDTASPLLAENQNNINGSGNPITTAAVTPGSGHEAIVVCGIVETTSNTHSNETVNSSTTNVNERVDQTDGSGGTCLWDLVEIASTGAGTYQGGVDVSTGSAVASANIGVFLASATHSASYTILNGAHQQLVNVNAGGTDVDALSYKNGVTLTDTELAALLDGSSFGSRDVAVFADQTGDAQAMQKRLSAIMTGIEFRSA